MTVLAEFLAVLVFWTLAVAVAVFVILAATTLILEVRDWRRRYPRPPYGQRILIEGRRRRG